MSAEVAAADYEDTAVPSWPATLDALEADLDATDSFMSTVSEAQVLALAREWTPPEGLGALPEELSERAALLLERQLDTMQRVMDKMTKSRKERHLAARYASTGERHHDAAYYDGKH